MGKSCRRAYESASVSSKRGEKTNTETDKKKKTNIKFKGRFNHGQ